MFANAARILKPRQNGDFALLMMLSLNLLVLVFFMLLNSMATPGTPHPDARLARDSGVPLDTNSAAEGLNVPLAPVAAWRESVITRLRGTIMNRIDVRVLPQAANADELQVEVPMKEIFGGDGRLRKPEFVRNMLVAAGEGSTVGWSLVTPSGATGSAAAMAALSRLTKTAVAWKEGENELLRIRIVPGMAGKPDIGLNVQTLGENANGEVKGVDAGGVR